jgi:hypothetical protein
LKGLKRSGEALAPQDRLEPLNERGGLPDVDRAVDVDEAANGIRRGVDRGDPGRDRVPDDHRLIDPHARERGVDPRGGLAQSAGFAARLAVAGQVKRDAAHVFPESLDDRPPRGAVNVSPCRNTTGTRSPCCS